MSTSIPARQQRELWRLRLGRILSAPTMKNRTVGKVGHVQQPQAAAAAPRKPAPTVIATGAKPPPGSTAHAALHEAAHATVLSRGGVSFKDVRLFETRGEVAGIDTPSDAKGLECVVLSALAGGAAANEVDFCYPGASLVVHGASGDFRQAVEWINTLCRDHKFEEREPLIRHGLSPLAIFEERAFRFVGTHQRAIYLVANELLARKKLTSSEVAEIISPILAEHQ